jgi:NAD(P)-dependent dehydrogenase (short-subunit alcohol dehydrogenase family)
VGRFEGRNIVVTGAASGIGEATARGIVRDGGNVIIADLQEDKGKALAETLGPAAVFQQTDVSREEDVAAAVAAAQREFGELHGMVNNAGIVGAVGSIMETSVEAYDHTMAILSRAVFLGIKHAGLAMKSNRRGAIVSIASTAGIVGGLGPHVYTMAKHGVVGLTKSAACEMAGYGIRVNAVAPGSTVTAMTSAVINDDPEDRETAARHIAEGSPLGFAGLPDDIANAILYLLSDEARYVNGHTLVVDAGQTTGGIPPDFYAWEADVLLHAGRRSSTE